MRLKRHRQHQVLKVKAERCPWALSLLSPRVTLGALKYMDSQAPPGQMELLFDGGVWASGVLKVPPGDSNVLPGRRTVKPYIPFQNGHNEGK